VWWWYEVEHYSSIVDDTPRMMVEGEDRDALRWNNVFASFAPEF
jgi:hypothetical protein